MTTVGVEGLLAEVASVDGPGVAVGIYRDGALVSVAARGLACLEHAGPIGSRTRFDLASVSKQMTAACALLLHRDHVVDLDADARTWLPELRPAGVTLRHCLHHTSGLPDYEEVTLLRGDPLATLARMPQLLGWLGAVDRTHFPPGSDISYSNTGYVAVAAALSRAAGRSFAELMRAFVFAPLGMTETLVHDTIGLVVPGMAFSYDEESVGHLRREMPEELVGDGGVLSHLEDLAAWHGFLVDGRVLGADIRHQLVAPAVLANGRPSRYAAGVSRHSFEGHDLLAHAGSMYAYRSCLLSVPAEGLGVTVLSNRGGTDAYALGLEVLRDGLRHVPRERLPRLDPPRLPAGRWVCRETGEVLYATCADGVLSLDWGGGPVGLTWDHSEAWQSTDGRWRARGRPSGELHVEDDLGRIKHFVAVTDDRALGVAVPAGRYHDATLGEVTVLRRGTRALIVLGRRRPAVLVPTAAYGVDWFFRALLPRPVWVRWRSRDDTLTVSTGGGVHRLAPRRQGSVSVSRFGERRGTPPIPH